MQWVRMKRNGTNFYASMRIMRETEHSQSFTVMCLPFWGSHQFSNSPNPLSAYRNWVNSARCITSLFLEHRRTKIIKCPQCRSAEGSANRPIYSLVLRHYLHFGFTDAFKRCSACQVKLASTGDVRGCSLCREEQPLFLDFLSRQGLRPWTETEPTIVALSTSRN